MTGPELKALIFRYLESRGWKNLKPTEYYGWDSPGDDKDRSRTKHYCWHAAVAVQIALDEGKALPVDPAAAENCGFGVVTGGRK